MAFPLLGILTAIPNILSGANSIAGSISEVMNKRTELEAKKVEAKNNVERAKIEQEIAAVDARKDVLIAEAQAGIRNNSIIRNFMGFSFSTFIFKYFFIDKVLGPVAGCVGEVAKNKAGCYIFTMDPITTEMAALLGVSIAFYFLTNK
jgi:hypothetical protein